MAKLFGNSWILLHVRVLGRVRLFATPWTVAHQAPLSVGFSGQNTGLACHFLLQIFLTQGLDLHLLHWPSEKPRPCFSRLSRAGAVLPLGLMSPCFLRASLCVSSALSLGGLGGKFERRCIWTFTCALTGEAQPWLLAMWFSRSVSCALGPFC